MFAGAIRSRQRRADRNFRPWSGGVYAVPSPWSGLCARTGARGRSTASLPEYVMNYFYGIRTMPSAPTSTTAACSLFDNVLWIAGRNTRILVVKPMHSCVKSCEQSETAQYLLRPSATRPICCTGLAARRSTIRCRLAAIDERSDSNFACPHTSANKQASCLAVVIGAEGHCRMVESLTCNGVPFSRFSP